MLQFSDLNLNKHLLSALSDLGFEHPTPIQEKAFSTIMSGRDAIGIAQTGTGKTLAYLLPSLRLWTFSKERFPQILIVVPTRELVVQIVEVVESLTTYMNVAVAGVYGGTGMLTQMETVEAGLDVLVATPGRLIDLVMKGSLKLKNIKRFVLDEVDEMMDLGFKHQIVTILDMLPEKRQNLLFSATMTEDVEELLNDYFDHPSKIEIVASGQPLENIEQKVYEVPNFYTKINLLSHLLDEDEEMDKVLVFVSTKKMADMLFEIMNKEFPRHFGIIHSNKSQNYRFHTIDQFDQNAFPYLISTDLVSRGIDIEDISHVINFDLPSTAESYIHRIGRTGRAEKKGVAISFVSPQEMYKKESIEELMSMKMPTIEIPDEVEISDKEIEQEKPVIQMKNVLVKKFDPTQTGEAFHKKAKKNTKTVLTRAELARKRNLKKKK